VVPVEGGDWQSAGVIGARPKNRSVAHMLVEMPVRRFPMALGVLYEDPAPTFESACSRRTRKPARARSRTSRSSSEKGRAGKSPRNRTSSDSALSVEGQYRPVLLLRRAGDDLPLTQQESVADDLRLLLKAISSRGQPGRSA
jgi:hypothetical protein